VELLRRLADQLLELLALDAADPAVADQADPLAALVGMPDPEAPAPTRSADPALARLFPDGYRDDDAAARELRRLTEGDLRDGKRAAVTALRAGLDKPAQQVIDREVAELWLAALNDLRLVMGTRLEVDEDIGRQMRRLEHNDPRLAALHIYNWLTDVQATLIEAL
jgi:hypothetical protein